MAHKTFNYDSFVDSEPLFEFSVNDVTYGMRRPKNLSIDEASSLQKLQKGVEKISANVEEEDLSLVKPFYAGMLKILCPSFPLDDLTPAGLLGKIMQDFMEEMKSGQQVEEESPNVEQTPVM